MQDADHAQRPLPGRRASAVVVVALLLCAMLPVAAATIYGASAPAFTVDAGNRALTSLSFGGTVTNSMTGADFLRFNNGRVGEPAHTGQQFATLWNWTDEMPRDVTTSGHVHVFSPDRADGSTGYAGEAGSTGRLNEIFGSFGGYKNMSWILDGEASAATYWVDLYFNFGTLTADSLATTVELAVLERGGNSDFNVYGITVASTGSTFGTYSPTLTSALSVARANMGGALWTLNTLEIDNAQNVTGVGISLDQSWGALVGVRIESAGESFAGPDIVAVGVVPEPASLTLAALAAAAFAGRRRRRR